MTRSQFGSSFHTASPWSWNPDWVFIIRPWNDITSCVDIYMQHDKQQTAGRRRWRTHGCWFGSCRSDSHLITLDLVWIWFDLIYPSVDTVWTASWLADVNIVCWSLGGAYRGSGMYIRGRGRSLGSIGNMNKQFSLYYIYLFKVISIQHKHTFSPQIMYFNMNNSYQHHHLFPKGSIRQRCCCCCCCFGALFKFWICYL